MDRNWKKLHYPISLVHLLRETGSWILRAFTTANPNGGGNHGHSKISTSGPFFPVAGGSRWEIQLTTCKRAPGFFFNPATSHRGNTTPDIPSPFSPVTFIAPSPGG